MILHDRHESASIRTSMPMPTPSCRNRSARSPTPPRPCPPGCPPGCSRSGSYGPALVSRPWLRRFGCAPGQAPGSLPTAAVCCPRSAGTSNSDCVPAPCAVWLRPTPWNSGWTSLVSTPWPCVAGPALACRSCSNWGGPAAPGRAQWPCSPRRRIRSTGSMSATRSGSSMRRSRRRCSTARTLSCCWGTWPVPAEQPPTTAEAVESFGPVAESVLRQLANQGMMGSAASDGSGSTAIARPIWRTCAAAVEPLSMIKSGTGRVMGTMDGSSAPAQLHPGAVYTHLGVTHLVESLDLDGGIAVVRRERPGYTTVGAVGQRPADERASRSRARWVPAPCISARWR